MMKATEAGDMGTSVVKGELVLRDATAHSNLVGELWSGSGWRATREPGSWFLLSDIARLALGKK